MAYKFTTGSVARGDIYYENDVGKNTYLDWGEDALDLVVGGRSMIKMIEASTDKVVINNGGMDVDLQIKSNNNSNLIRTDAGNDRVGIGRTGPGDEDPPTSTFDVSGSQAGNLTTTEVNITLDETHFMLVMEGDVGYPGGAAGITASLPAANTCAGRIYHLFNQTGMPDDPYTGGSAQILFTGNNEIDGSDHIELDGEEGNTSISLVSNGGDDQDGSWLIFGQYTPQDEGE